MCGGDGFVAGNKYVAGYDCEAGDECVAGDRCDGGLVWVICVWEDGCGRCVCGRWMCDGVYYG